MGPIYDYMMSQPQYTGTYSGVASPNVPGLKYGHYTPAPNWVSPQVGSKNLMSRPADLTSTASRIGDLAQTVTAAVRTWESKALPVLTPDAVGSWHEAELLTKAIARSHSSFKAFVANLAAAHEDVSQKLKTSAAHYTSVEHANVAAIRKAAAAPSATVINYGGNNQHVDPSYGTGLSAAQYAQIQHLEELGGGSQPVWTKTEAITDNVTFTKTNQKVDSQTLQSWLKNTNPDAIADAGQAYTALQDTLTDVAGKLNIHAKTLADNWSGGNAVTAVSQLQQLQQTASDLQANAYAAGQALSWYGPTLSTYKSNVPKPEQAPMVATPVDQAAQQQANNAAADAAAQQHFDALNTHIETAYYAMPPAVNQNLPMAKWAASGSGTGTSTIGGGGGGPAAPLPGATAVPSAPPRSTGSAPGSNGSGPWLASSGPTLPTAPPPVTGPAPTPVPTQPTGPTVPIAPPVSVPGRTSGGPGGPGNPTDPANPSAGPEPDPAPTPPGEDVPPLPHGPNGIIGDNPTGGAGDPIGGVGEPPVAAPPGSSLAATDGAAPIADGDGAGNFMPGMGGFGGSGSGNGEFRARQSWEPEDDSIWSAQDDALFSPGGPTITNGIIGSGPLPGAGGNAAAAAAGPAADGSYPAGEGGYPMAGAPGSRRDDDKDRNRDAWMNEDPDIWCQGLQTVPAVIS